MTEKKESIRTQFDSSAEGTLAFEINTTIEGEITGCLELIAQLRKDYQHQEDIVKGLRGIEEQVRDLRGCKDSEETIRLKLDSLMQVSLSEDKSFRLDAFRRSAAKSQVGSEEEYVEQVNKMLRNTRNNVALLLLGNEEDNILTRFLGELSEINEEHYQALKPRMNDLAKSPQLWHYNEKKKAFLSEWLRPFQDMLDLPIDQMSEEEFQQALKKVESLRNGKLEEMTHLMVESDREPFRRHNRAMNPLINSRDEEFWGGTEARDEFLQLMNKLITRFSFSLEDRFLIFRTKDGGFTYLVGFADEAFDQAITTGEGKLALYPHLKVFIRAREGEYMELSREFYNRDAKAFYNNLKTAVVPFLGAAAVMVEAELSDNIKRAFDMWI